MKLYSLIIICSASLYAETIDFEQKNSEYRKLCDTLNNLTVCGHLSAGAVLTPVLTLLLKTPCTRGAGRGISLRAPKNLQFNYTLVMPVNTGSAGQALITDGNGNLSFGPAGGSLLTTAYVDGGNNFGADATVGLTSNNNLDIVTNSTARVRVSNSGDITLNSGKLFKFSNSGDTASVGLKAPAAIAADIILNLPSTTGAAGQFLQTDGANPATLTWANGGNVSGSGAANQVTYWSGANTITGSNNLTYNGTTTVTFGATGAFDSAGGITVSAPSGAGDALTVNANATDNSLVVTGGAGATAQTITAGTAQSGLAVTGDSATAVTISGGTGTKLAITGSGTNPAVTVAGNTLDMLGAKAVRFFNAGNTFSTGLVGGANVANATLTLPIDVGTSGQFLQTNGASPAVLSWASAGNVTGSGAANQVTYWSGANTITGSNNLTYNGTTTVTFGTTGVLASAGGVTVSAPSGAGNTLTAVASATGVGLVVTGGTGATAETIASGTNQKALTVTGNGTANAVEITAGSSSGGGLLITGGSGSGVPLSVTAAAGTGSVVTVTGNATGAAVTVAGNTLDMLGAKAVRFFNAGNTFSTGLVGGANVANATLTLPIDVGASGQFLQTNGASPAVLSWASAGNVTGSGAANQVTYWSGANTITGSNNLTYNGTTTVAFGTTGVLASAGGVTVSAPSGAGNTLTAVASATGVGLVVTGGAGATAHTVTAGTAQSGLAVTGDSATAVTISGGTGAKLSITGSTSNTAATITAGSGQVGLAVVGTGAGVAHTVTGGSATAFTVTPGTNQKSFTTTGNGTANAVEITAGSSSGGGLLITGGSGSGVPLSVTAAAGTGSAVTITGGNSATAVTITPGTNQTALSASGGGSSTLASLLGSGTGGSLLVQQTSGAGSALIVRGSGSGHALLSSNNTSSFPAISVADTAGTFGGFSNTARIICNGNMTLPSGTGSIFSISDSRIKQNISAITTAVSSTRIRALTPKSFQFTTDFVNTYGGVEAGTTYKGFVAQDFQLVYPEYVVTTPSVDVLGVPITNMLSISTGALIPDIVGAVQETANSLDTLTAAVPTGSGSINQVTWWSGTKTLTSNSNFGFDGNTATITAGSGQVGLAVVGTGAGVAQTITGGSATALTITPGTNQKCLTVTGNGTANAVEITAGSSSGGGLLITGGSGSGVPLSVTAAAGTGTCAAFTGNSTSTAVTVAAGSGRIGLAITGSATGDAVRISGSSTDPAVALNISNTAGTFASPGVASTRLLCNGNLALPNIITNLVTIISDQRFKRNIQLVEAVKSLNRILQVRVNKFDFIDEFVTLNGDEFAKTHTGFVAQEFEQVYPDAIAITPKLKVGDTEYTDVMTLSPLVVVPDLVGSVQELAQQMNSMQQRLNGLEEKVNKILEYLHLSRDS